jgi:hypothetical protein
MVLLPSLVIMIITAYSGDHDNTAFTGDHDNTAFTGDHDNTAFTDDHDNTAFSGDHDTAAFSGDHDTTAFSGDNDNTAFSGLIMILKDHCVASQRHNQQFNHSTTYPLTLSYSPPCWSITSLETREGSTTSLGALPRDLVVLGSLRLVTPGYEGLWLDAYALLEH